MKRYGNLFEKIVDIDNLLIAHQNARRGKSHYHEVRMVDGNPVAFAKRIRDLLVSKKFTTSEYQAFWKDCGKKQRLIHKLPYYPDRIIQHAIMQILEPIFVSTLIRDTFQSIKGRGTHDARQRVQKAVRKQQCLYYLQFDIEKFYPSVDNNVMKQIIRKKIKCPDTLYLLDDIIDSTKGLPVGNYSSQILGNLYLNHIDHFAKETLGIKHYFRYCDDIVLLCETKDQCYQIKEKLFEKIYNINLKIKPNWIISNIGQGIDFVGWKFFPHTTKVRKRTAKRFARKVRHIKRNHKKISPKSKISAVMSYWGQFKYSNSKTFWKRHVTKELIEKTNKYTINNPIKKVMI